MSLRERLDRIGLHTAMGLPESVQRRLAGKPVVRDGQTLDPDVQLMLALQRVTREPSPGDQPVPEGRRTILRATRLTGVRQPIGSVRDLTVAGRPARLYTPSAPGGRVETPGPLLLFFHGGGFMHGDLDSHDPACRFLAERSGVRVLAVDYRLGPEHRFPAAYDDAVAAYHWLVEHAAEVGADVERLAVGGDSAGGNLAAGVAIEAARAVLPLRFQLLVYPATDGRRDTESSRLFADGFFLTSAYMELANASYATGDADLDDPRYSPQHADLPAGLAPAFVVTAGFDPLRDEGEAYARRLAEAGVTVDLRRFPGQIHGFFNIVGAGRTSRAANALIAAKLKVALSA